MGSAGIEQRRREDAKTFNRKELKELKETTKGGGRDRWKKENR